jgi:hypothetical protein
MNLTLTSSEKVIFNATVKFHMEHQNLSLTEAQKLAVDKITRTRALSKKIAFKY